MSEPPDIRDRHESDAGGMRVAEWQEKHFGQSSADLRRAFSTREQEVRQIQIPPSVAQQGNGTGIEANTLQSAVSMETPRDLLGNARETVPAERIRPEIDPTELRFVNRLPMVPAAFSYTRTSHRSVGNYFRETAPLRRPLPSLIRLEENSVQLDIETAPSVAPRFTNTGAGQENPTARDNLSRGHEAEGRWMWRDQDGQEAAASSYRSSHRYNNVLPSETARTNNPSVHRFGDIPGTGFGTTNQPMSFNPRLHSTNAQQPWPAASGTRALFDGSGRSNSKPVKVQPFPKDVAAADKLFRWKFWLQGFEAALERNMVTSQREKAVDLSISAGDEIGLIIMTERLMVPPESAPIDFAHYDYMKNGITSFLSKLTDNNTNAREFNKLQQKPGESVKDYALRATLAAQKIELDNPSLLAATFTSGLSDKVTASLAQAFNWSMETAQEVATRRESNPGEQFPWGSASSTSQPLAVAAVDRATHTAAAEYATRRERETRNERYRDGHRQERRSRSRSRRSPENRERKQHSRTDEKRGRTSKGTAPCSKCGRFAHRGGRCPADSARCFACQQTGHFEAMCKQRVVRNVEKVMRREQVNNE